MDADATPEDPVRVKRGRLEGKFIDSLFLSAFPFLTLCYRKSEHNPI